MSESQDKSAPLFTAVANGSIEAATAALDAGAIVDTRDDDGWSALDRAAGCGDTPMVQLLLDHGADPFGTGPEQRTAYDIAVAAGRLDTARALRSVQVRLDPTSADDHLWRPYCKAYQLGQLRVAAGWDAAARVDELTDDSVVFLHDDYTVTRAMWPGEDVVFDAVSPDWISFCQQVLMFAVPDELDLVPKP
ncbi:ankyrin repeat domain-containing protein [Micromonospora sp. NPDC051296]|uniref:ankyrin repeat domain-containing protein n=1 Tax=Micromonospora sp. NPDC051296 TaxID=3155046 RepID=UPI00342FB9BD